MDRRTLILSGMAASLGGCASTGSSGRSAERSSSEPSTDQICSTKSKSCCSGGTGSTPVATRGAAGVLIVGAGPKLVERDVDVKSAYFEVRGRLRLENRVLETRSLVERPVQSAQGLGVVRIAVGRGTGRSSADAPGAKPHHTHLHARSSRFAATHKASISSSDASAGSRPCTASPASIARARNSTCQCAFPLGTVNAAGIAITSAPASVSAANNAGNRRS